jgi:hypothetical protein
MCHDSCRDIRAVVTTVWSVVTTVVTTYCHDKLLRQPSRQTVKTGCYDNRHDRLSRQVVTTSVMTERHDRLLRQTSWQVVMTCVKMDCHDKVTTVTTGCLDMLRYAVLITVTTVIKTVLRMLVLISTFFNELHSVNLHERKHPKLVKMFYLQEKIHSEKLSFKLKNNY